MTTKKVLHKMALFEHYEEILRRGCLDDAQRRLLLEGRPVAGVIVQQSGGSGGGEPLRLPRTQEEMSWLAAKLMQGYLTHYPMLPERTALVGGISHTVAREHIRISDMQIRDFAGDQFADLDVYDPDVISMYPSFAREIAANPSLRLSRLKAIKLGGEPILPWDLERLWDRFGPIPILEQFGSTEMPGLAFRTHTPSSDDPYEFSVDRFEFDFEENDGWQPLTVRDRFPRRAFPIESWYDTGDDVCLQQGTPMAFRRRDDTTSAIRNEIDALLQDGCVNVQLFPRESHVLCARAPTRSSGTIRLGEQDFVPRVEPPYRLVDSHKMPLVIDTRKIDKSRLFRYA
ncbi:MAG: hypothetical protein WBG86_10930 [Polyangiales bacterium]